MSNSYLISVFCMSWDHEIIFILIWKTGKTIYGSQLVQNT